MNWLILPDVSIIWNSSRWVMLYATLTSALTDEFSSRHTGDASIDNMPFTYIHFLLFLNRTYSFTDIKPEPHIKDNHCYSWMLICVCNFLFFFLYLPTSLGRPRKSHWGCEAVYKCRLQAHWWCLRVPEWGRSWDWNSYHDRPRSGEERGSIHRQ